MGMKANFFQYCSYSYPVLKAGKKQKERRVIPDSVQTSLGEIMNWEIINSHHLESQETILFSTVQDPPFEERQELAAPGNTQGNKNRVLNCSSWARQEFPIIGYSGLPGATAPVEFL